MPFLPETDYRHGTPSKIGVLLINLGTPEAPTRAALKAYLREFLSDPRVVEIPKLAWWPILNGIVLNTRPAKSAEKYAKIWTEDGSPLLCHTARQTRMLQGYLGERLGPSRVVVEFAMRYGRPSIADTMARLKSQNCERILVVPLYPQYAASTTATAYDALFETLARTRNVPELRTLKHYHDHPAYIAALAQSVRDHWQQNGRGELLLMSFHGLPRASLQQGDPYHCECQKTGRLLAEALGLERERYEVTFQSRFGWAEWLKPYTAEVLQGLPKRGIKQIDVICPGFSGDCLETLEEIAMEGKATFLNAGGSEYRYVPCLNERPDWINALCDIVVAQLAGWLPSSPEVAVAEGDLSRTRALAAGAPH